MGAEAANSGQTSVRRPVQRNGFATAYFGTPGNTVVTLICLVLLALAAKAAISWLVVNAVFNGTPDDCKASSGACWPYVGAKLRYMLFGIYPFEEQWRPFTATLLFILAMAVSGIPRLWGRPLLLAWPRSCRRFMC